jgi:hypothetical protein
MQVLIINQRDLLSDIVTQHDILINNANANIYGRVETEGNICVGSSAVFHGPVKCRSFTVASATEPVRFKKELRCKEIHTDGGIQAYDSVYVDEMISYDGYCFQYKTLSIAGQVYSSVPKGQKTIPAQLVPIQETDIVPFESCSQCGRESEVNVLKNVSGKSAFICFMCADSIIQRQYDEEWRVPYEWEFQFFSEEEQELFAKHHRVNFPIRYPDKPFIHVCQESQDGELVYKELSIIDPDNKYLNESDEEYYHKKLAYNGGPIAFMLQGISSAMTLSALLCVSSPPVAAMMALCLGFPSWKINKKISNAITDKILLPHEIKVRKDLIDNRRHDEETKQKSEIFIL